MGLIANVLEGMGISTIIVTTWPIVTEGTGAPRSLHVHFPMGNAIGEPGKPLQQKRILLSALEVMAQIMEPGTLVELPYRWRRMKVGD